LFTAAMILVDMASVVGASNNAVGDNGLLPWVMGVGIGVSIVSVGSAAGGLKREAHERAKRRDTPPKRLKDYPTLFGPDPVAGRWGDNLLAGGFVLVAAAIFVLRSVVAGGQLGIGYAAMGGLTLLGSYANSYLFGPFDKAAAVVRHLNSEKAQLRADRDAAEQNIEKAAGLATRPTSIKKIYRSEGKAAAALIQATVNHGIVLDHPSSFGIFEHDTAAAAAPMTPTTTPIQKRATRQPRAARKATDSGQGDGPVVGINSDGNVAVTGNGKAAK
jgi:outer membrane murein-binding lipoprotein Lpp